jgi:hypothetical protein
MATRENAMSNSFLLPACAMQRTVAGALCRSSN